jgi:hypothetical protein
LLLAQFATKTGLQKKMKGYRIGDSTYASFQYSTIIVMQGLQLSGFQIIKKAVFWDITPCGSCKNHVSEERSASIIRVTRIGELGTTLAATSNRRSLRNNGM